MDEKHFELAAILEQARRDEALSKIRRREEARTPPPDFDGSCPACGEAIPAPRRDLGYFICVPCQEKSEQCQKLNNPSSSV